MTVNIRSLLVILTDRIFNRLPLISANQSVISVQRDGGTTLKNLQYSRTTYFILHYIGRELSITVLWYRIPIQHYLRHVTRRERKCLFWTYHATTRHPILGQLPSLCREFVRRETNNAPPEQMQEEFEAFVLFFRACFLDPIATFIMRIDGINVSNWILDAKPCQSD